MGLATFGLGAAQGVSGFMQQSQAAARQNAYYQQNRLNADAALTQSYAADGQQLTEERNKASQDLFENEKKSVAAEGTAITAAGQAGVGGLSVDQLMGDYSARYSNYKSTVDQNYGSDAAYMQSVEASQQDGAVSRIDSVQKAVAPSWIDAGLRIGSAAVSGMGQYERDSYTSQAWKQNPGATMAYDGLY